MSFASKLKMESVGMMLTLIFYLIVGIISFAVLVIVYSPPSIGIIGIFSLVTAYGLFRKRSWTIWFVVVLFLTATVFATYTLYYSILRQDLLFTVGALAYLILTWVFTAYAASKRKTLET
ncbi:hypothetical protein MUO83_06260 [Candidatus Bathyarchaeota archaeon]|jgi:hypothetical protein|nr:hypothetical protein [Candidatus Bathyarchaeota archaeon]